ncbi:hypothetical protein QBC32DRAFT_108488 [Pseudoneurospora amorphoporcata]|uniref:DUF7924 domain-containing protein n=1 Tax=Pseudoneurospora amorphoporcata TaxID=241081 RepID=A0AAN6SKP3_9PEZI|nr:hypothetical protein QBC32DRAFT_108488 [Pseudoneurospora amorphoporcata]
MTLTVRGIVELFRTVKREDEVNRKILAFSVSHDHTSVRIYGHYPVIAGKDIKYYRHPIHRFDFTALDGKDKWIAYRFTKNVYDTWMPKHFENIRSAINQLPSELGFDVPPLSEATGLSQGNLMQSDASCASLPDERGSQSSIAGQQEKRDIEVHSHHTSHLVHKGKGRRTEQEFDGSASPTKDRKQNNFF